VRIIGGSARGLKLAEVGQGDAAAHLRPTADRVREALFNMLQGGRFGDPVGAARVLDLFAGTGALGLEALSRGASFAVFVDDGKVAGRLIRDNIGRMRAEARASLLPLDAASLPPNPGPAHDLVFLDPPYGLGLGQKALASALRNGWLAPGALVVWEDSAPQLPPPGLTALDQRRYGDTWITLLRFPDQPA
jgi:16S rRNA (guanine966-N2)-methyltransferase